MRENRTCSLSGGRRRVSTTRLLRPNTDEAAEQSRGAGHGGGGGKGPGQGEHGPAKRVPDAEPDKRAECAGPCAPSSEEGRESEVHGALPPRHDRPTRGGVPCAGAKGGARGGRGNVGAVRAATRRQPPRPACATASARVPGEAISE